MMGALMPGETRQAPFDRGALIAVAGSRFEDGNMSEYSGGPGGLQGSVEAVDDRALVGGSDRHRSWRGNL